VLPALEEEHARLIGRLLELVAQRVLADPRLRALLTEPLVPLLGSLIARPATAQRSPAYRVGPVLVSVDPFSVSVDGRTLTPKISISSRLLIVRFVSEPQRPLSAEEYRQLRGIGATEDQPGAALRQAVLRLRRKLPLPIIALPGNAYMLDAEPEMMCP
jgi:hypothetical protein